MRNLIAIIFIMFIAMMVDVPNSARADWRADLGTFRVGIVAPGNRAEAQRRVEPFRLALSEALGMDVEIFFAKDFATLINAQLATRIEYAVMSASAYAVTWLQCQCVEPLVIPMGSDQSKSYRAILIAGPKGPSKLDKLKPEDVLFPALGVLGGYSFAAYELEKNNNLTLTDKAGLKPLDPEDVVQKFIQTPESVLLGWSSMTGNPSTGYSRGTLKSLASKLKKNVTGYKIIWKSSEIPHPPHAVRKSLHKEAKGILKKTLRPMFERDPVAYDAVEPVFGGGFAPVKHAQYERFIAYVRDKAFFDVTSDKKAPGQ